MSIIQNARNIIRVAGIGSAMLASAGVAFADTNTNSTSVANTGANSVVTVSNVSSSTAVWTAINTAFTNNGVNALINTGGNTANQTTNVTGNGVMGGNATVGVSFATIANPGAGSAVMGP